MAINIKLQAFEGPLDLLLHLIDVNKIDIYDIPIVTITDQYLAYIQEMNRADMNVASEFLVMAATLLDIKCRMLLPKEVDEEGEEIDPRDELVEKLLEYKLYKYMSYTLKEKNLEAGNTFFRTRHLPEEVAQYEPPVDYEKLVGDNTLQTLNKLFQDILRRAEDRVDPVRSTFGKIEPEAIDMGQRVSDVKSHLLSNRRTSFRALLMRQESREEIIVTFLIVLEMMKTGVIRLEQEETFGEISIEVADEDQLKDLNIGQFEGEEGEN